MINDIEKIIIDEQKLNDLCAQLGKKISADYKGKSLVLIGLLKGCQPFMSDLIKHIECYCEIDYMIVSSYDGTKTTGNLKIKKDIDISIKDKDIIIVDDIIDTGITASGILNLLKEREPKSIEFCTLLNKPEGRLTNIDVKYFGTLIDNEFVVGYGLDYNELYRNLPFIGVLKEEIYLKKEFIDESKSKQ